MLKTRGHPNNSINNNLQTKSSYIGKYITILLLLTFTNFGQKAFGQNPQNRHPETSISQNTTGTNSLENINIGNSYRLILEAGIRNSLKNIDTISDIPNGGIIIDYSLRSLGINITGITDEHIRSLNLPDRFDISPRIMGENTKFIIFHLGNRKFKIEPKRFAGKLINYNLTKDGFEIKTAFRIPITKDREEGLPDFIYRLRTTPRGKGEKSGFTGIIVTEL